MDTAAPRIKEDRYRLGPVVRIKTWRQLRLHALHDLEERSPPELIALDGGQTERGRRQGFESSSAEFMYQQDPAIRKSASKTKSTNASRNWEDSDRTWPWLLSGALVGHDVLDYGELLPLTLPFIFNDDPIEVIKIACAEPRGLGGFTTSRGVLPKCDGDSTGNPGPGLPARIAIPFPPREIGWLAMTRKGRIDPWKELPARSQPPSCRPPAASKYQ